MAVLPVAEANVQKVTDSADKDTVKFYLVQETDDYGIQLTSYWNKDEKRWKEEIVEYAAFPLHMLTNIKW